MEHKAYTPCARRDSVTMTRMKRDLSSSPHQETFIEADSDPQMMRQAVGRIPHVCVIGAGVAGLRCADILLQHGVNVTILEGRDRVGGRVKEFVLLISEDFMGLT